ncbi:MAG TPA: hypothetical protein VGL42_05395 [Opitutaceae bacterium]|jgi:hypothetical protein
MHEKTPKDHPEEALQHVLYEIEMALETVQAVAKTPRGWQHSAFLESFLIHIRCLEEFFTDPAGTPRPDDMRPRDFVSDWVEKSVEHPEVKRMHKEVAHLTYSRKRHVLDGAWSLGPTARPVFEECESFLSAVAGISNLMSFGDNMVEVLKLRLGLAQYLRPVALGSHSALSSSKGCTGPAAPQTGQTGFTGPYPSGGVGPPH